MDGQSWLHLYPTFLHVLVWLECSLTLVVDGHSDGCCFSCLHPFANLEMCLEHLILPRLDGSGHIVAVVGIGKHYQHINQVQGTLPSRRMPCSSFHDVETINTIEQLWNTSSFPHAIGR